MAKKGFKDTTAAGLYFSQPAQDTQGTEEPKEEAAQQETQAQPQAPAPTKKPKPAPAKSDKDKPERRPSFAIPANWQPPLPTGMKREARSKRVQLLVQPSLFDAANSLAMQEGQSFNDFVHGLLEQAVKEASNGQSR